MAVHTHLGASLDKTGSVVGNAGGLDTIPFVNLDNLHGVSAEELYQRALQMQKNNCLTHGELSQVASALLQVQEVLDKGNQGKFVVRQARLSDLDALCNMVNYWAQQGENLPRSREDITRNILTFAVCVKDHEVLGCACLYVYDTGLAEIRSLGVNPLVQRQGQGRALVDFLVHRAWQFEIKKVFVLTRNPEFFAKVGFSKTTIEALPEKIRKDCEHCPKFDRCDEVAYEVNLPEKLEPKA